MADDALRAHLVRILDWADAHVTFDQSVENLAHDRRNTLPEGLPYSAWHLVEHIRFTQNDILDFCINAGYEHRNWPDDYWPNKNVDPADDLWEGSLAAIKADRDALKRIAMEADLFARIPHGKGQTFLREILLVADHTAYHVGQIVLVRRLLGQWPARR